MSEKIYRVGIIGCGGMGRSHANAFQKHYRTEVVAAMDIDPDAANRLAEEYSVPGVRKAPSQGLGRVVILFVFKKAEVPALRAFHRGSGLPLRFVAFFIGH